ncbi:hypothetical protein D046_2614A, partial [Vibrio parahaemolyticus V-223/04]
MTRQPDR